MPREISSYSLAYISNTTTITLCDPTIVAKIGQIKILESIYKYNKYV